MIKIQASQIEYVDVIIIGGGIAGISIAEFLARHSRLSIKVLDSAPKLGTFASGKLEGWFHTGAHKQDCCRHMYHDISDNHLNRLPIDHYWSLLFCVMSSFVLLTFISKELVKYWY